MKKLILAGAVVSFALGCAEPTSVEHPVAGSKPQYYAEGPQEPPQGVPPEYEIPTEINVSAGAGYSSSAAETNAYGQAVVNYYATNANAKAVLEIPGYPNATAETQVYNFLPGFRGLTATANRTISEVCGKSIRTEALGEAWFEFVSTVLLSWGKVKGSANYTTMLPACPINGDSGIDHCDFYQLSISYDGGKTWVDNGDPQWLCPGDEPVWATRKGIKSGLTNSSVASFARAIDRNSAVRKEATLLFLGTHYLEPNAHAFVQSGSKLGVDAVVIVDTMRASPDDVEAAILAAAYSINTRRLSDSQRLAVGKSGLRLTGPAKTRAVERAKPILQATKQSRGVLTITGWTGRALKTTVKLPVVNSADSQR